MKNYRYMFRKRSVKGDSPLPNNLSTPLSPPRNKSNNNTNAHTHFRKKNIILKRNELSQSQSFIDHDQLTLNNKCFKTNDSSLINLHPGRNHNHMANIKKLGSNSSSPSIKKLSSQSTHQLHSVPYVKRSNFRLQRTSNRNSAVNFLSFEARSMEGSPQNSQLKLARNVSMSVHESSQSKKRSIRLYNNIRNKINDILNESCNIENDTKDEFPVLTRQYFDKRLGLFQTRNLKSNEVADDIVAIKEEKEKYLKSRNENLLEKRQHLETLLSKAEFYVKLNPSCAYQHRYHFANTNGFNWDERYQYKKKDRNKIKTQIPVQSNTHSKYKVKGIICKPETLLI